MSIKITIVFINLAIFILIMKILYLFVVLLSGIHAFVINQEPELAFEKKEYSNQGGYALTPEDFERGDKIVLVPPDKDAILPFEEGDIIDPDDNALFKKRNSKRGVFLDSLWPNKTVPYLITTGFYQNETALIARAISEFRRKTCVRWTPRTIEKDYVFFGKSNRCATYVGRQGGCQLLMMKPNLCFHFTTLLHEMMHTLGFVHEHQRRDRNKYVTINTKNLLKTRGVKTNILDIPAGTTTVGDYDFESVMHYGSKASSINGFPTIVPKDNDHVNLQKGASFSIGDITEINYVYKCDSAKPSWKKGK